MFKRQKQTVRYSRFARAHGEVQLREHLGRRLPVERAAHVG